MGHPEPFNLTIGIGNEQWEKDGNQWYERYEAFENNDFYDSYSRSVSVYTGEYAAKTYDVYYNYIQKIRGCREMC